MKLKNIFVTVAAVIILVGCGTNPTRDTANGFILRNSGQVAKNDVPVFVELGFVVFHPLKTALLLHQG